METIEYKELVDEYNDALVNVLRGFRPRYEFLERWVPDADAGKSIRNLIEAAQIAGEPEVTLALDQETWGVLDMERLKKFVSTLGRFESRREGPKTILKVSHMNNGAVKEKNGLSASSPYAKALAETLGHISHEGTIQEDDELLAIRSNHEGVSLFALVDTAKHAVVKAAFGGTANPTEKALLERLCRIIPGMTLQEVSDHAVLKLEYELRDPAVKFPVQGIFNYFNMDKVFDLPKKLTKGLLDIYKEKAAYKPGWNFFDESPAKAWIDLTDDDKRSKVQAAADRFLADAGVKDASIVVGHIDMGVKTHISFEGTITPAEKARLMMRLEVALREQVEKKIQLYLEPQKDRNKIRRL